MRTTMRLSLAAISAGMLLGAASALTPATARAQTMGEYGATVGQAAGLGSGARNLSVSDIHIGAMAGTGRPSIIDVPSDQRDDDSHSYSTRDNKEDSNSKAGDEWSRVN